MTGLLASVADRVEMEVARTAGADIVDCKAPARGALGAWHAPALRAAVVLWKSWPEPKPRLSATIGDQPMVPAILREAATRVAGAGVPMVKLGLFPSPFATDCIEALAPLAARTRLIGVFFADLAPDFGLLDDLARAGFFGAMIDTSDKKAGGLRAHLDDLTLAAFVEDARMRGLATGLAGSLTLADAAPLAAIGPDYLGFRGALCADGRTGRIDEARVRALRTEVTGATRDAR